MRIIDPLDWPLKMRSTMKRSNSDSLIRRFRNEIVERIDSRVQNVNNTIEKRIEFVACFLSLLFLLLHDHTQRFTRLMRPQFVDQVMNVNEKQFDFVQLLLA